MQVLRDFTSFQFSGVELQMVLTLVLSLIAYLHMGDASQGMKAVDSFIKELRLADYLNQATQALPL